MLAGEIGVRAITRVDHADHHAGARGLVPGRRRVDAAGGLEVVPLLVVARVVGRERCAHDAIGLGVLDVRIAGGDVARELRRLPRATGGDPTLSTCEPSAVVRSRFMVTPKRAAGSSVPRICVACPAAAASADVLRYLTMMRSVKPRIGGHGRQRREHHQPDRERTEAHASLAS